MRTFGVEEELLLVDAGTGEPLPAGDWAAALQEDDTLTGHQVTEELQEEQLEVVSPPQTTLAGQLTAIRAGRALAEQAAARVGGRVVALPTALGPVSPHPVPGLRHRRIATKFGLTASEQLTNGFHIHVGINSRAEGVAVLDRIRVWLPTLLALSANSPFWHGDDSGFASYRYQVWSRWPTAGPTDVFGTPDAYHRYRSALLDTQVPVDADMLYFDARLSDHHPTVEIRVADVCLDATHAAVIATLARALVETTARAWADGSPAMPVPATLLRTWSWQASRSGIAGELIDPATGAPAPAGDILIRLLHVVGPVLAEYGEQSVIESGVAQILREGTGAQQQREAYAERHSLGDVMAAALDATHQVPPGPSTAGAPAPGHPEWDASLQAAIQGPVALEPLITEPLIAEPVTAGPVPPGPGIPDHPEDDAPQGLPAVV
ncbi:MAG: glutamate--cysteine ligase [Micrococcus sp.]|nr:glutamate--cysteine ligase [Micrococcus sp.]